MEFLGSPDKIIAGFGPELFGGPLNDDDVIDTKVYKKGDDTYYQWDLKPHRKVVATATGNRVRSLWSFQQVHTLMPPAIQGSWFNRHAVVRAADAHHLPANVNSPNRFWPIVKSIGVLADELTHRGNCRCSC